jgi:hypothetical protein
MTPAQRRKNFIKKRAGKKGKFKPLRVIIGTLFILLFALFLSFGTKYWNGRKLSVAINTKEGDIVVSTFDIQNEEITNILIPASTELTLARQLGTWRARSVWKLGMNEKFEGELVKETVIRNFHFPVTAWADSGALGFGSGDGVGAIKAAFTPYKTNLNLPDRLRLLFFALGTKSANINDLDLGQTTLLRKTKLIDGEEGYVLTSRIPETIIIIFSDNAFAQGNFRVIIKDASGKNLLGEAVGQTIELLGAKVASVEKQNPADFDCYVAGKNAEFTEKLAQVFSCQRNKASPEGNFDAEMGIGEAFAKRY